MQAGVCLHAAKYLDSCPLTVPRRAIITVCVLPPLTKRGLTVKALPLLLRLSVLFVYVFYILKNFLKYANCSGILQFAYKNIISDFQIKAYKVLQLFYLCGIITHRLFKIFIL